jgi:hypothetical protein
MKRNSMVIGGVIIVFLIALIILAVTRVATDPTDVMIWKSPNGEHKIDILELGDVTLYTTAVTVGSERFVYSFRYSPEEINDILIVQDVREFFKDRTGLYITRDVEAGNITGNLDFLALLEFKRVLEQSKTGLYNFPTALGLTTETEKSLLLEIPTVTCDDADSKVGVIYVKLGETNQVYREGDCLIVEGDSGDGLVMSADKLSYTLLGLF